MRNYFEMNTSFDLRNPVKDNVAIKNEAKFKRMVEICSALLFGNDEGKFGAEKDAVAKKLSQLGTNAANGDFKARSEINTIVKFIVEPKLIEAMKIFSFLGNYHELRYDQMPKVKTYNYEGLDARMQAANSDVSFAGRNWIEYAVNTRTISSGMSVDYRELASENFDGTTAEEISQVHIDMNNKAVAYVLATVKNALSKNTKYVSNFGTYSGELPTEAEVKKRIDFTRRMGKVAILGDHSLIQEISGWNGYQTVGDVKLPFFSPAMVDEIARAGYNGNYKGCSLVEMENPFNYTKPLPDKTGFETYYSTDELYFTAAGAQSPLNIFRRGGIMTMSGNDVETGTVKTRFDIEVGADVVKGREFEIGMLAKQD